MCGTTEGLAEVLQLQLGIGRVARQDTHRLHPLAEGNHQLLVDLCEAICKLEPGRKLPHLIRRSHLLDRSESLMENRTVE